MNFVGILVDFEKFVVRVIYVCGMVDVVDDLCFLFGVGVVGCVVLVVGVVIFCDVWMVVEGVICLWLFVVNWVICIFNEVDVLVFVMEFGNICLVVVLEYWCEYLEGSVVVIGNVLIVLFYLLEMFDVGVLKLVLILGFLVGFVGVVEFKEMFVVDSCGVFYVIVCGCCGGSVMVVVVVNVLVMECE